MLGVAGGGEETDGRRVQPPCRKRLERPEGEREMRSDRKEAAEDRLLRRNIGERRKERRTHDQRTQHTPERAFELPLPSGVLANQESEALVAAWRRGRDCRELQWRIPSSAASFLAQRLRLIPYRETAEACWRGLHSSTVGLLPAPCNPQPAPRLNGSMQTQYSENKSVGTEISKHSPTPGTIHVLRY